MPTESRRPIAVIFTASILAIAGCGIEDSRNSQNQDAIQRIHEDMGRLSKAWESEMAATNDPTVAASACSTLISKLADLDTSSCPPDYQKQYSALVASLADVRDIFNELDARPELSEKLNEAIQRCSDEGGRLNEVAESYGVRIEPLDNDT